VGALIDQLRPDAVFDCTVPTAHPTVTLAALARGCHVLGEKPIAPTLDEARGMVAAAGAAGKLYAVIQNRRYDPIIRALARVPRQRRDRADHHRDERVLHRAHFGGFRDRMPHVLLVDMAIHTFDAARFLTGADPEAVYCQEWNPAESWYDRDAAAVAVFTLSGGIVYTYHGSWCAEGVNTTWEADWRIVGTRGSVTWDGANGFRAQVIAGREGLRSTYRDLELPPYDDADLLTGHAGVIDDFIRCLRDGGTPETIGTDNIKSLAMVLGAVESADRGARVAIVL
jgi:predicted dehydrogenase